MPTGEERGRQERRNKGEDGNTASKDDCLIEIKKGSPERKCYLCGRTEEESLRAIGIGGSDNTSFNEVNQQKIFVASEIARINAQRMNKIEEFKRYLEVLLVDAKGYPDDITLEEVLSSEESTMKLMPRIKDLLKYVKRTHLILGSSSISKEGFINIGYVKREIAGLIRLLDGGDFPEDLKEYEPEWWESVRELPPEKIPEDVTVVVPRKLCLAEYTIAFEADLDGRDVYYYEADPQRDCGWFRLPPERKTKDFQNTRAGYKVNPQSVVKYRFSVYLCGICASLLSRHYAVPSRLIQIENKGTNQDQSKG